ncbi:MAG TPA: histidine--tRNA ligase [Vampirovibrionales bacterium]
MQRPKSSPRGTYDLLPSESAKWSYVEGIAKNILDKAGFSELRTPIFESTEIFKRAVGESSDIVNKEMYTFEDRSERSLTLRPEGTASIVRAFLSNGLDRATKPVKVWYYGPMFRYERAQTGRYRQFTQLGLEAFGSASPEMEFEVINLAISIFKELKIEGLSLEINSVGDTSSRAKYQDAMKTFLEKHNDEICPDCQRRKESNPLRALDCKVPEDQKLYTEKAPQIQDYLNDECLQHQERLINLLKQFEIPYTLNQRLVRGLDYYSKTVFEIKTSDERLGVHNTICAGGRYDGLVKQFGGQETPAVGWALGMERLMILLADNLEENTYDFFVTYPKDAFDKGIKITTKLREQGLRVGIDYENKKQDKQFELGKKQNSKQIVSINEDGSLLVKNLETSESQSFNTIEELIKE